MGFESNNINIGKRYFVTGLVFGTKFVDNPFQRFSFVWPENLYIFLPFGNIGLWPLWQTFNVTVLLVAKSLNVEKDLLADSLITQFYLIYDTGFEWTSLIESETYLKRFWSMQREFTDLNFKFDPLRSVGSNLTHVADAAICR